MCYHNSINTDSKNLEARYKAKLKYDSFKPIYHASAFTFPSWPILSNMDPEEIVPMKWGLIPHWTKSEQDAKSIRSKTLNARIETVKEKPSFREAAAHKRCLIPSTGFFEFRDENGKKIPYYIFLNQEKIFSMAGIWDSWNDPEKGEIFTFSILTTEANVLMKKIHNLKHRMPVILEKEMEDGYLNGEVSYQDLFQPLDAREMDAYTISRKLMDKENNVPEVTKPQSYDSPQQMKLF